VTEEGVVRPGFAAGLRDATEQARARWAAMPGYRAIRPRPSEEPADEPADGPAAASEVTG
jgi:hypothetical protein